VTDSRRRALIIGARYGAADDGFGGDQELDFAEELAGEFANVLGKSWVLHGGEPLLSPDAQGVRDAIREAVALAAADGATLLIHYIGHGQVTTTTRTPSFYLQVKGSSRSPSSDSSVLLNVVLSEALSGAAGIDGVMLLIDACSSSNLPKGTIDMLGEVVGGRLEVLTAATDAAFDGCFTRTLLQVLQDGLQSAGDYLHPAALLSRLGESCSAQVPMQLSYNSGRRNAYGVFDEGLWLVPNPARTRHALTGRPDVGRIDQLLRGVLLSSAQLSVLYELDDHRGARLRIVEGPAGSGKSTLLAALVAPPADLRLPARVAAALFLDNTSTAEGIAIELSAQLSATVPNFAAAVAAIAAQPRAVESADFDSLDQLVILPAAATLNSVGPSVDVVFDAIDQVPASARHRVIRVIERLTKVDGLEKFRVIITTRGDADGSEVLREGTTFFLAPPSSADVKAASLPGGPEPKFTEAVDEGGWLTGRLLIALNSGARADEKTLQELTDTLIALASERLGDSSDLDRVLRILFVSGLGPGMPVDVLTAASHELGGTSDSAHLRTVLGTLGPLIQRSRAGETNEHVGLSHARLAAILKSRLGSDRAHGAIARALASLYSHSNQRPAAWIAQYARESWVVHALADGDALMALTALLTVSAPTEPEPNAERWAAHLPHITALLGPDHPKALSARRSLALWRAKAGDLTEAVMDLEALLADQLRVLGPDHPDTLTTRNSLAYTRSDLGDVTGAATAFEELLADQLRVLGKDHPYTLTTRSNLARNTDRSGNVRGAVAAFEELLADRLRVLGPDHPDTLTTRNDLANSRRRAGDTSGAAAELRELLTDRLRVLGPDHPDTLVSRGDLALAIAKSGDLVGAVARFEELLTDRLRVLGPNHPDTLTTRNSLAYTRGDLGDAAGAAAEFEELLADRVRVLGPNHPYTLTTRSNLALWTGEAGDLKRAQAMLQDLLADRLRVLGPDHPDTFTTRNNLANVRGKDRDVEGAVAAFEELLTDQLRVLGPDNPSTLITWSNLAHWKSKAGYVADAIATLEALLVARLKVLGADHPDTLTTLRDLAELRYKTRDWVGATAAFEELLAYQLRLLGPIHSQTLTTRNRLAKLQR
jgi:hypothetical protein